MSSTSSSRLGIIPWNSKCLLQTSSSQKMISPIFREARHHQSINILMTGPCRLAAPHRRRTSLRTMTWIISRQSPSFLIMNLMLITSSRALFGVDPSWHLCYDFSLLWTIMTSLLLIAPTQSLTTHLIWHTYCALSQLSQTDISDYCIAELWRYLQPSV